MDKNVRFSAIVGDEIILQNGRKTELACMDKKIAFALADEIKTKMGGTDEGQLETVVSLRDGLKPCPFCGEYPVFHRGYGTYALLHSCEAIKSNIGRGKKNDVIEKWNNRGGVASN